MCQCYTFSNTNFLVLLYEQCGPLFRGKLLCFLNPFLFFLISDFYNSNSNFFFLSLSSKSQIMGNSLYMLEPCPQISQPLIHLLSRVAHAINHLAYENTIIQTLLRFFSFFTYLKIILLLNCLNSRTQRYRFQLQWPWELLLFRMMTIKIRQLTFCCKLV